MTSKLMLSMILAVLAGGGAAAQSPTQRVVIDRGAATARPDGMVRIQMSVQLFLPGPTDDGEEAEKHRERARRALYSLASKECDVLREAIASDCRLEAININLNRQGGGQAQGYAASGTMTFQITLK
jgi:hypothetical protein